MHANPLGNTTPTSRSLDDDFRGSPRAAGDGGEPNPGRTTSAHASRKSPQGRYGSDPALAQLRGSSSPEPGQLQKGVTYKYCVDDSSQADASVTAKLYEFEAKEEARREATARHAREAREAREAATMAQQSEANVIANMKCQQEQINRLEALLRDKGHAVGGERHAAHAADEAVKTEHREGDVEEPRHTATPCQAWRSGIGMRPAQPTTRTTARKDKMYLQARC